jgi:hypothetical protein
MPTLKALAFLHHKRTVQAVNVLVACAVMVTFATQHDIMVRALGVGACNVYLFFVAMLTLHRVRRESATA